MKILQFVLAIGVTLLTSNLWMVNAQTHRENATPKSEKNRQGESRPASYRPQVGEPHPDFVLPRIDNGKALRLSDFRGKKVLLVHFASW